MRNRHVAVIGAGMAGLAAALDLARQGIAVTVFDRTAEAGGKLRQNPSPAGGIDSGPTVFTLRGVFDELFADAGANLADCVALQPLQVLARHFWADSASLDLYADGARTADAIGGFAGSAAARAYTRFSRDAARIFNALDRPFMRAPRPTLPGLMWRMGLRGVPDLLRLRPYTSLWDALGEYFDDPRLRQLFARYSTYCGGSPFRTPATLMLVRHAEQQGVWRLAGGMQSLASALVELSRRKGVVYRFGAEVTAIRAAGGRVSGVVLAGGETVAADAVVMNGDAGALAAGLFGADVRRAVRPISPRRRSLSAITWTMQAEAGNFPLAHHSVLFAEDYRREFDDLFVRRYSPERPTVYLCAQDRGDGDGAPLGPERLFCLVNAPADGDAKPYDDAEMQRCEERTFRQMAALGLNLRPVPATVRRTSPADFARRFPATGGALYGRTPHGWRASFLRPGARTRAAGLYLAGGSVHPGPGLPMAALSGRLAAATILQDFASTRR